LILSRNGDVVYFLVLFRLSKTGMVELC